MATNEDAKRLEDAKRIRKIYAQFRLAGYQANHALSYARNYVRADNAELFLDWEWDTDYSARDFDYECHCDKRNVDWRGNVNHSNDCCLEHSHVGALLARQDDKGIAPTYNDHGSISNGRTINGDGVRLYGYSIWGYCESITSGRQGEIQRMEILADLSSEYFDACDKRQYELIQDRIA